MPQKRPLNLTAWQRTKRRFGLFRRRIKRTLAKKPLPKEKNPNKGLQGRADYEKWLTAKDVRRITITDRELGRGDDGIVYIGRVYFKDPRIKPRRAAIKIFHNSLTNYAAMEYQQIIENLAKAGVPIPKMSMARMKNPKTGKREWVQVSQLFGTEKRMTIGEKKHPLKAIIEAATPKQREEIVEIYSRFINAGYFMPHDSLHYLATHPAGMQYDRIRLIPLDITVLYGQRLLPHNKTALADAISNKMNALVTKHLAGRSIFAYFIDGILERVKDPELKLLLERRLRPKKQPAESFGVPSQAP